MPLFLFEEFLHRARRHWTAWMMLEYAGIGLLGGCLCVLLLLPILLWRGEPGQSVAIILPSLGAITGSILGFRRRPSLRDIAQFADDRFQTADLLATALAVRGNRDPWHVGILNMADARSAALSPALLTSHRLGGRAWSGIALALIASITLGLLSITTSSNRAQAVAPPAWADAWRALENADARGPVALQPQSSAAREALAEKTPDSQSIHDTNLAEQQYQPAGQFNNALRQGQADGGAGRASARTESSQVKIPNEHPQATAQESGSNGPAASAGQGGEVHSHFDDGTTTGQVSADRGSAAAPWSSSGWPAAQTAALDAVGKGRVPDEYRNLVRDYFQNQQDQAEASHNQK